MTVSNQTAKVTANGNDVATSFSFNPIQIFASTELSVVFVSTTGTETSLIEGAGIANYTVVVTSYPGTGSITYPSSGTDYLATGEKLIIKRVLPLEQATELASQGGYNAQRVEDELDKGVMIDLQQQEELDRSVKFAISVTGLDTEIVGTPTATYLIAVNSAGTGLTMVPNSGTAGATGPAGPQGPAGASGAGTGDLLAANNLSDLASAATARTNLGLAIGTNVQAYDAELAAVAGLTSAANKIIKFTGAGTAAVIDFLDEDAMTSDDANALASQQSIKAYVDSNIATTNSTVKGINTQTVDYTLVLTDAGKIVELNKATAITLTVPLNATVAYPTNTRIDVVQYGAGQVTIAATGGVTIRSSGSKLKLFGQYSGATLYKRGTDEWVLIGDLTS